MTRALARTALLAVISGVLLGQSPDAPPQFVMADVHASPHSSSPQQFMRAGFYKGGRYQIRSATMVDLISTAYGVDADKVLSGPNWLEFDHFDVLAQAPPNATPESAKAMLKTLLADRFKLVVHIDKKESPTFALVVGKKPLLKEADGSGDTGCKFEVKGLPEGGGGRGGGPNDGPPPELTLSFTCSNMTMAAFAEYIHTMPLGNQIAGSNPLVDETGLKGAWNFDFHFAFSPQAGPNGAAMLDDVEKQLGLKLEPRKVPLPVVIVDSVNEKPTDNLPGVTAKLPVAPTEFEVADIKPSDPNASGPGRGGGFQPGGRLDLRGITLKQLVVVAWDTMPDLVVGGPKFIDTDKFDIVAKAPAQATTGTAAGQGNQPPFDIDALRLMLRALIIDRFKLTTHMEERPMDAYTLLAAKPKMKKADPSNRTSWKEGPGPDGKDPRKDFPALDRLVTCQNMSMAQLAELLPSIANGYFQTVSRTVLDSTGIEGSFDFTLSFSGAQILNGGGGGGRGGDRGGAAPPPPPGAAGGGVGAAEASDPSGGITLMDAMEKQLGIKMITTKRPVPVLVIDHIEEKPTDN